MYQPQEIFINKLTYYDFSNVFKYFGLVIYSLEGLLFFGITDRHHPGPPLESFLSEIWKDVFHPDARGFVCVRRGHLLSDGFLRVHGSGLVNLI
jgi:hypothetical protein